MRTHFALIGIPAGGGALEVIHAAPEYAAVKAVLNEARAAGEASKYDLLQLVVVKSGDFTKKEFRQRWDNFKHTAAEAKKATSKQPQK